MSDINQLLMNMLSGQSSAEELLSGSDLDPVSRMILSQAFTGNNQETDEDNIDSETGDDTLSRRSRAIQRLRTRFAKMQRQIEDLQQQLEEMEVRNDELAAALGACYLCWGEDPECPECQGKGQPGSIEPEWELFREWVLPAIKAVQVARSQRWKRQGHTVQPIQPQTEEP
ncbi:MAG: hypothetical protein IGS38_06580 [Synechococcales cyanobacterium M58_A2018_015]|nr:hypothetical protein [Synechococcales cyanobacterium M58_A2018_015]